MRDGVFSGTIINNSCNAYDGTSLPSPLATPTPTCQAFTIPDPAFGSSSLRAAPLLGTVGVTLNAKQTGLDTGTFEATGSQVATGGGMLIYGPFEAGFTPGQGCDNQAGDGCDAGWDVGTCVAHLAEQCGEDELDAGLPGATGTCGAHANPHHVHVSFDCLEGAGESPLLSSPAHL